jgi:hypothetical protein
MGFSRSNWFYPIQLDGFDESNQTTNKFVATINGRAAVRPYKKKGSLKLPFYIYGNVFI